MRAVALLAALALAACAHVPAPYRTDAGPHRVEVADVEVGGPGRDRDLPLRILWPADGGPYPVLVFSHGGGSAGDEYDRLARHWASAGYVVILPTHRDSRRFGFNAQRAAPAEMLAILDTRRADLVFVVDSLDDLPQRLPALAGRIDAEHIAVGGHSMGGATALTVTGLVLEDPRSGSRFGFREPRFDALLLLTEPANSPMMAPEPWRAVPVPVFVATGSRDYSGQWDGPPKQRFFRMPADLPLPAGVPRHYLFIEGMDHYLGGLVCRSDVPGPPDEGAVEAIRATGTVFLDAYLKDDAAARSFLREGELGPLTAGRATLSVR
jgi:predicted dienelactone hydrolase